MQEITHSFGNYSIRYLLESDPKGGNYKFVIPRTNILNQPGGYITRVIHGDKNFTLDTWAEMCRSRTYGGAKVTKAALIYGGELKYPGRFMLPDGSWHERAEHAFNYDIIDGGTVCQQFIDDGNVTVVFDPEPKPEPIVTVSEPNAPEDITLDDVIPEEEENAPSPGDADVSVAVEKLNALQQQYDELEAELAALKESKMKIMAMPEGNKRKQGTVTMDDIPPKPKKQK